MRPARIYVRRGRTYQLAIATKGKTRTRKIVKTVRIPKK